MIALEISDNERLFCPCGKIKVVIKQNEKKNELMKSKASPNNFAPKEMTEAEEVQA